MNSLVTLAARHLEATVRTAICLKETEKAVVIYDTEAALTGVIVEGYKLAIPEATFIEFGTVTAAEIMEQINGCTPGDLVVLVQSSNFRLNEFRFRIELFQRSLKTIEHLHLGRISEDQFETYVNALAYDADYYRPLGRALKEKLDVAEHILVECAGTKLEYKTGMESTKLNIGDYAGMKNVGGSFPIGEVFTEAKDLTMVNGEAMIFAFAGDDHRVRIVEPFKVVIEQGILTAPNAPKEFLEILELIKADEEVLVREFGLGLNIAMGKHTLVNDITAFERQKGMHLSLGAKHAIYAKPGLNRKKGRYHVDIFVDIERITADGGGIYQNGDFTI